MTGGEGDRALDRVAHREQVLQKLRDTGKEDFREANIIQTQRMQAMSQLARGVANDLDELLGYVRVNCEMLLNSIRPDDPKHELAAKIDKAAGQAASLVRQLSVFGQGEPLVSELIDLNELIMGMERLLRGILGEGIELVSTLDTALGKVKGDPEQIRQVLLNMAEHARDTMREGGNFRISTSNVQLGETFTAAQPEISPGRYVMVGVADTGPGMNDATRARIFEPFSSASEKGGTGMRLSVVYGIIKQSGGHIDVWSAPGRGTSFKIYLPLFEPLVP
jgi:two-component system, cell cycle sensor histidine kinase and response regulator CckA